MKIRSIFASLAIAIAVTTPALAADEPQHGSGHYEWRQQPGPRANLREQVWVPDRPRLASCDCDMMKMQASDCMKSMHRNEATSEG